MTSTKIMMEDICGPTLKTELKDIGTWILLTYPLIALLLNFFILIFINRNARKTKALGVRDNEKEVKTKKQMTFGVILQSLLPVFSQLPMVTSALFYWSVRSTTRMGL
ncbi:hypothetical protein L596_019599 [Steinernema carpocapsae]|uniref:Uncharacterized protein n=1 Tax=Steinernema carpocapsae TaxID=34508 RepID=A0A4V6A0M3_STECR|nr:hypothetical protein L596_019599 [Steinernema carpocapsae]